MSPSGVPSAEVTRRASVVVADLERWLAGGEPSAITKAHGWPDADEVKRNIAALRPLGDLTVTFDIDRKDTAMPTPTPPPQRPAVAAGPPDTIANLLAASHQHDKPAIRKQAERIDALLARLRADIKADREDAKRRAEIAELEERLRALKGTPAKKVAPARTKPEPVACPDCGKECGGNVGLSAHRRIVHEGINPNAKAAS